MLTSIVVEGHVSCSVSNVTCVGVDSLKFMCKQHK